METTETNRLNSPDNIILAPAKRRTKPKEKPVREFDPVQKLVDLPELKFSEVEVQIIGKTPLIVHAWSQKAVKMMLGKQLGEASKGREKKDPFQDFVGSLYPVEVEGQTKYGVPAPSFKACAVSAANAVELKMTQMKQAFHVASYTVPIIAPPLKQEFFTEWDEKYKKELGSYHKLGIGMRMDVVRLQTGVADLRFRGWFPVWEAKLLIEFNPALISLAQLLNLFRAGGWGVGIGEWRPGAPECRSGEHGRFTLKTL